MTTLAPTSIITTIAPTTPEPTTHPPTTSLTTLSPTTPLPVDRDVLLDYFKIVGPIEFGAITIQGSLGGTSLSSVDCIIELDPIEITGSFLEGELVVDGMIELGPIEITGQFYLGIGECGWVAWSDIGSLKFDINERNVAGKRPMDWAGCVYDILKLGEVVVVYGAGGVTIMKPVDIKWGMQTIHRFGIPCKLAVDGTDSEHYFIDNNFRLYKLTVAKGLELLDYSEYLLTLTNPRLHLDTAERILYICDGEYGFVYGTATGSFGEGPINVTGVGSKGGVLYVGAPAEIEIPKFQICTDIYDLGSRKPKTIQRIEIGTDLTDKLEAQVEMRYGNREQDFTKSNWVLVNPSGIAYLPAHGIEFRFRLKSPHIYEYFEVDYIKVQGVVHGVGYLDIAR